MPRPANTLSYHNGEELRTPKPGIPGRLFVPAFLAVFLAVLGLIALFLYLCGGRII